MGFSRIYKIVKSYQDNRSTCIKTLKIQEEAGELAAEVFRDAGMKKVPLLKRSRERKY